MRKTMLLHPMSMVSTEILILLKIVNSPSIAGLMTNLKIALRESSLVLLFSSCRDRASACGIKHCLALEPTWRRIAQLHRMAVTTQHPS